jgi:hypothetical protein
MLKLEMSAESMLAFQGMRQNKNFLQLASQNSKHKKSTSLSKEERLSEMADFAFMFLEMFERKGELDIFRGQPNVFKQGEAERSGHTLTLGLSFPDTSGKASPFLPRAIPFRKQEQL